jgi:HEAT repeat protein
MGGISLKFISKAVIVLCIVSGVAYLSIRYQQGSKETTSSKGPSITKKIEQATPTPAEGYSKANADLKSAEGKGQEDSSWVDSVLKALDDPNVKSRVRAVRSLKKYASSPEALDLLSKFLKDKDSVVIRNVIDTLGYIGLQGHLKDEVFNILAQKAMDKNFAHRGDSLTMAAIIGKERLLPTVTDFLHEDQKDESAKNFAVRALSLIDSSECVPLLAEVLSLQTKNPKTHQVAFDTLASIGTPEALALLREHVVSSEGADQWASAQALARLDR